MNRLKGKIELINSHDELLLIELNVQETKMKAIIIGKPNDYSYLEIGNEIAILFKETPLGHTHPQGSNSLLGFKLYDILVLLHGSV